LKIKEYCGKWQNLTHINFSYTMYIDFSDLKLEF